MTEQSLATVPVQESRFLAPAATIEMAVERFNMMGQFVKSVMREGLDFGTIPGTSKPTLYKPGAEKLTTLFGLSSKFVPVESIYDWSGGDHDGEPFFYFKYKAQIYSGERLIAEGEGSCNSWEKKYRYRNAERHCPKCGAATIQKSKQKPEFYCWSKKGGCGATFPLNDPQITGQVLGPVKNPDAADLVNTLQKMAQKRAFIAGVLIATNASEYFTQDLDDFAPPDDDIVDGSYTVVQPGNGNGKPPAQTPPPAAAKASTPPPATRIDMSLIEAAQVRTPRGALIHNCTPEQLKTLIEKSTDNLMVAAARFYADDGAPDTAIIEELARLHIEAQKLGLDPAHYDPPQGASIGQYRQMYSRLENAIAENQIK